ncbi:MAG: hypothetical protein HN392_09715 [Anaerolineae bacterium]|jgi:uncharacterized protein|nr:hypothetical protein [Anaerolineae bacterium]MBT7074592.1 hypothetical protein [Anaerolineae bacterium]MBT7782306.1 hypothetical protein [Anaerolineae bacterium]
MTEKKKVSPSLADKLKSLGVKVGMKKTADRSISDRVPIERVLKGDYRQMPSGESFVYEQRFAIDDLHGDISLSPVPTPGILAEYAKDARIGELSIENFIFFDTETSGLSGGTGTYAFMVGVGRYEGDKFILAQFFLRDPSEERAMLEALAEFFAYGEVLVSYNGKSFDAPLLRTRYKLHSMPLPFEDYAHIDLLHLARRLWRDRLASRTLQSIEKHILGIARTSEEVPGYEIPYLYFDYLRDKDARPMKGIFYHNEIDILSLATLLKHIAMMLSDPFGESVEESLDIIAIAKLFEDMKKWDDAAHLYEYGLAKEVPEEDFQKAVKRLAILQRRRGDIDEAVKWWKGAAAEGQIYAWVELAKYYEHRVKDYALAVDATHSALSLMKESKNPHARTFWAEELAHRLKRLERKNTGKS